MLEPFTDRLKAKLKNWTLGMVPADLPDRIAAARPTKGNEYGLDAFGFSLEYALAAMAPFIWMYRHYFRAETQGLENIPKGRALLVANHSGQLPFDATMIGVAVLTQADPPRPIRSMVEKWAQTLPYVSIFFARLGQVVGTPQNARKLLESEEALLVFPEGIKGITKLWKDRYQLKEFGRGFMRLALETNTPIVPVAVIGAEEQAMALYDFKALARLLKMPALPITPTLLPIPLPSRYYIRFGEPIYFTGSPNEEDAELEQKVKMVRTTIQTMLNKGLRERKRIF